MADEIKHYEVTHPYGKVKVGLRFSALLKSSRDKKGSLAEGLADATGITISEAHTALCNIKYKEI